jgi:L-ascorbate metabolism protein UlaG (beta-lactamase superfamily)
MVITWYGQSCFKIQSGETVIFTDPFSKETGLTPPRGQAHIVTVSHNHFDHNNVETLTGEPLVVAGPGEYETKGINIRGIFSYHDDKEGKERGTNTIYVLEVEGVKICHLGDLGQKKLTDEQLEQIDEVDILLVPVGGEATIDAEEAAEIISQIEPRLVIPMHYKIPGLALKFAGVEPFLKEMGVAKKETVEKLTLKKKDLPTEGTEVVVLKV